MQIHIATDHPVRTIFAHMHKAGHDIRIVGGYVRDMLMGAGGANVYGLDMDLATPARPETVQQIFTSAGYKVLPIGIEHGTVQVVIANKNTHTVFQITTLRQDIQTDGRHATVAFTDDWQTDAKRRDLTINGLYADADGSVYDYCGGMQDIADKKLRFIGDVRTRIQEDTLRIIRFWRFVVKTGWQYDRTLCPIFQQMAPQIRHVSRERIRDEMIKMLSYPSDATDAIHAMQACGVMARIVPFPIRNPMPLMTQGVATSIDIYAKIIAICDGNESHVKTLGDVWGLSNTQKRHLQTIMTVYSNRTFVPPVLHRFLYYYGYDAVLSAGRLKNRQFFDTIRSQYPYEKPKFPLSGTDLIKMGIPQGAKLGGMLKSIESWWVDQQCTPKKQDCLIMALRLKK